MLNDERRCRSDSAGRRALCAVAWQRTLAAAVATLVLMSYPARVAAQRATVYYDHSPAGGDASARMGYMAPGSATRLEQRPPRPIEVDENGQVCFVIDHANPLLYSYAISTKALTVDTPSEFGTVASAFTAALGALTSGLGAAASGVTEPEDQQALREYSDSVTTLVSAARALDSLKWASESEPVFDSTYARAQVLIRRGRVANQVADALYKKWGATTAVWVGAGARVMQELKSTPLARLGELDTEFSAARTASRSRLCTDVGRSGVSAALSITPKATPPRTSGVTLDRPTDSKDGKPVASVEVDPQSTALFEVAPGAVVNLAVRDRREFRLENGVVRASSGSPTFDPGLFVNIRTGRRSPIWATFGVIQSEGRKAAPFIGILQRFGYSLSGPHATLGIGVSILEVTTELTKGAVDQPLPADVTRLEDIVRRERKPALGVTFTVSGFEFGKKSAQ
jgi:hypothetical protein